MKKTKIYRHGEIGLTLIEELPKNLELSGSKTIVKGSHGHSHDISQGELYFKNVNEYVFGYLVAKDTKLLHLEHGTKINGQKMREAILPDGVYELRKQQEVVNNELKPVID